MRALRATTAAPPDPARQGHHGGMTAQPPSGETDAEARTRHLAWLNNQTALPPARIRETYEQHGRGVWQAIYGDDPAVTYVPLARVNPRVFHLAEAYDPEDQFVVVIRDLPRIGIYTAPHHRRRRGRLPGLTSAPPGLAHADVTTAGHIDRSETRWSP